MRTAKIIDFASRCEIASTRSASPDPHASGIFRTARQAGAYVYAMSAKMPSLDDAGINGWIAARDIITATYHHYDDLEQTDRLTLAIARTSRLMAHSSGPAITAHIDGRTQRIQVSISSRTIEISFALGDRPAIYSFGRFEDSYIPIDMQLPGKLH